jgi:hypothetical protein
VFQDTRDGRRSAARLNFGLTRISFANAEACERPIGCGITGEGEGEHLQSNATGSARPLLVRIGLRFAVVSKKTGFAASCGQDLSEVTLRGTGRIDIDETFLTN